MLTIAKLFGKSPFSPLQGHMKKVGGCLKKLTDIFAALAENPKANLDEMVAELGRLEEEANLTKNDIRNHLPKSLFLPIDRSQLLEILSIQDSLADKALEIGELLLLRPLERFEDIGKALLSLYHENNEVFWDTCGIIKEFDELLESSFGGIEAEKVKTMVENVAKKKQGADRQRIALRKRFFEIADTLPAPTFYLWSRVIEEVGTLSHIAERLANRMRMILELK